MTEQRTRTDNSSVRVPDRIPIGRISSTQTKVYRYIEKRSNRSGPLISRYTAFKKKLRPAAIACVSEIQPRSQVGTSPDSAAESGRDLGGVCREHLVSASAARDQPRSSGRGDLGGGGGGAMGAEQTQALAERRRIAPVDHIVIPVLCADGEGLEPILCHGHEHELPASPARRARLPLALFGAVLLMLVFGAGLLMPHAQGLASSTPAARQRGGSTGGFTDPL
jgi:hypothetical protein